MSDAPLLDAAVLDDLIEHIGAESAHAVIELFIGECRELAAAIGAAGASRDSMRRAAHSLKSSAGQLGAAALAEAALAVETAAGTVAQLAPQLIGELLDCAARTEAVLAARLAG
jgi:HPt (histidine-containing phosphotransfer) domain-containing protein